MHFKYSVLILLYIISISTFSQISDSTQIPSPTTASLTPTLKSNTEEVFTELDYYKVLYEKEKENNESFKSLIQWTLGVSLGFLLAIIGSQIFFNYRLNKKEIDYIKKDIDEKILELENKLIEKIQLKFDEIDDGLKEGLAKNQKENKEFLVDRLNSDSKVLDAELKLLKNVTEFDIKVLQDELEGGISSLKELILKNKGDIWNLKGIDSIALSNYIEVAFIKLKRKNEVKYILNDIIEVLKELNEIHDRDFKNLKLLYKRIIDSHGVLAKQINELVKNKEVYSFDEGVDNWNTGTDGLIEKKVIKVDKKDREGNDEN